MQLIDENLLNQTCAKAKKSARLRMNHNFHADNADPINRLINAMELGTYVRPHRHLTPNKDEAYILLRGRVGVFVFDDDGCILEKHILDPKQGMYGGDIKAGTWHTVVVLESGSVLYEAKEGPFTPLAPTDFAPWSPAPEDTEAVAAYLEMLTKAL